MSPGVPLLTSTFSSSAALTRAPLAEPESSVTHREVPKVDGLDSSGQKAGVPNNIVSIRDFLDCKGVRR
jgi:hypothetical protein